MDSTRNTSFSLASLNPIKPIENFFEGISSWWKELPQKIAEQTVELMADLYELCASLILKTPLWIFDNEWFQNMTLQFSAFSLGIVTVLTVVESIKRMLSSWRKGKPRPMEMKDIMIRWGIVSGVLTVVPFMFQKSFQALNFISDKVISMGSSTMKNVALPETIQAFDVITLVLFNIALICTVIPVLWKNGRRFFDIMILGVITPFALTAWIFDSYRHLFNQWWDNLKQLSVVQIYYALFLLMLGWFIFGVPTPDTFSGLIIKLLVTIGGFARMADPPKLMSKHMDSEDGFNKVYSGINKTKKNAQKSVEIVKSVAQGPKGVATTIWKSAVKTPKIVPVGGSRMSRFHNK